MIARVQTAFAARLGAKATCLQAHTHPAFHVHDPDLAHEPKGPCHVVTTGLLAKSDLLVRNPAQRTVHLVAIDQCLYTDANPSKCDCALVCGDIIYFVEFKTSTGITHSNPGDCLTQLAASIRDFYDRNIIQPGQTVFAYASVGFPRNRPQNGAHHADQLISLQQKVQEGAARRIRLRFCSESELDIK